MPRAGFATAGRFATLGLLLAVCACGKIEQPDPQAPEKARAAAKRQQAACGSATGYDRLKDILFDQAVVGRSKDSADLDKLADYSFVRVENPIVKGWDPELEITRCSGRIILEMPAGVRAAFAGERRLQADIGYTAQAAADGNGFVYTLQGAEPIIARLASFNMASRTYQPPPAIDPGADDPEASPPTVIARANVPSPQPTTSDSPPVAARKTAPPPLRQAKRPDPAPDRTVPESNRTVPAVAERDAGEATVRAFYNALGTGDGAAASARVIPEKRASRAFSPDAISKFYGRLPEPLRLLEVVPISRDTYRVRYRYSAGRSKCDGTAVVRLVDRGSETLIRGIDAKNGC